MASHGLFGRLRAWNLVLLAGACPQAFGAATYDWDVKAGVDVVKPIHSSTVDQNRPFFAGELSAQTEWKQTRAARWVGKRKKKFKVRVKKIPFEYALAFRVDKELAEDSPYKNRGRFIPKKATIGFQNDLMQMTVGWQEVTWGETFGINPVDVVNPRDLTATPFDDQSVIKRPNAMINGQFFYAGQTLQLLVTPVPTKVQVPPKLEGIPINDDLKFTAGKDAEFAARYGFLVSGFDAKIFYARYWNRLPSYRLTILPTGPVLDRQTFPVDGVGASMSYAGEAWVLRADTIVNNGQPTPVIQETVKTSRQWQTVLGGDVSTDDGNVSVGLQYHVDTWSERYNEDMKDPNWQWLSAQVVWSFWDQRVKWKSLAYGGIDNGDRWFQNGIEATLWEHFLVDLHVDSVAADTTGYLFPYRESSRIALSAATKW